MGKEREHSKTIEKKSRAHRNEEKEENEETERIKRKRD